jgi:flagellar export protein FliJ
MKKLGTLIRLQKRELDEVRSKMNKLETKRDHFIRQIEELSESLQHEYEMAADMAEMRGFFGDFSGSIKKRQQVLAAHIVQVETQIQHYMIEIQKQFSELKKLEIAKERNDEAEALEARRAEQKFMDEIGIRNAIYHETF